MNLDEKQLEKVRALERGLAKAEILGAELEVAQIELEEILEREPVNLKAVEAKLKKMESLAHRDSTGPHSIRRGNQIIIDPGTKKSLEAASSDPSR